MDRYHEREVYLRGVYCFAQVLNWSEGKPPKYLVVNSLDNRRPGEWVVEDRMGAWMDVDLVRVIGEVNKL